MTLRNKFTKEAIKEIFDNTPPDPIGDTSAITKPTPQQREGREEEDIFQSTRDQWQKSEQCKQLILIIQSINVLVNINQIVAFACGSIRNDLDTDQETPRSSCQHSLILTLRDILDGKREDLGSVSCYAQEPAYSDTDKLILGDHGITVLDDQDGFLRVDDSTLVISCAPQVPVKQIIIDLARPAAMIWNRIEAHDDTDIVW
jgi:hypothetical protein